MKMHQDSGETSVMASPPPSSFAAMQQPPGIRTKRGGGIGFMYDEPSMQQHPGVIFKPATAASTLDDVSNGFAHRNGEPRPPAMHSSEVGPHNWRDHFDPDVVAYVLEDTRLSTLQRRLVKEPNATTALALAYQISASVLLTENKHYVRRLLDVICEAVVEVFYSKHADAVKDESARALGKVGFVVAEFASDFDKYYAWLWKGFEDAKKENAQNLYLRAMAAMLRLEPRFGGGEEVVHRIMKDLQELLERTNHSGFLLTLVDSLVTISKWKPKLFEPIFQV